MKRDLLARLACLCLLATPAVAQQKPTCDGCAMPSASTPPRAAEPGSASQDLEKLDADLDRATLAGDKAAAASLLADGMISVDGEGEVTDRDKWLSRIRPAPASMKTSISSSGTQVKQFGDTAVLISKKTRHWEMNGRPNSFDYHEAKTYVMRDGGWRLAVSQHFEETPPYVARDVAFDLPFDASQASGDRNAAIVLYEFSDYECPFCRKFAAETLARVETDYVRPGRVALVFRNYPLEMHPRAFDAAVAGECAASSGKFWSMNEKLLRDPVALSKEDFARDAKEAGIEPAAFERCVNDPATAERIRRQMAEAAAVGVRGTPMFVIGVRKPGGASVRAIRMIDGAYPYEIFQATLDSLIHARNP